MGNRETVGDRAGVPGKGGIGRMKKTRLRRGLLAVAAWCCLTLALASCTPLAESQPAPGVEVAAETGVKLTPELRGETLLLDIRSERGIGTATVTLPADMAVRDLILRLHLAGLEELRFTYGTNEVHVAVSSSDMIVREENLRAGATAALSLGHASDFWMDVGILSGNPQQPAAIPLDGGYFDVRAPRDFLRGGTRSFTVAWIDFYR